MNYDERLNLLISTIKKSKLNNEEFKMIYGILELSEDRNTFNRQYNLKVDKIIKKKESVVNE